MDDAAENINQILDAGFWDISAERRVTRAACEEVLRRLPPDLVSEIMETEKIILIAPGRGDLGKTLPLTTNSLHRESTPPFRMTVREGGKSIETEAPSISFTRCRFSVVYLAPELDTFGDQRAVVAVVAHEIAHAVTRNIMGAESEIQADNLIKKWGFTAELECLRSLNPRHRW